MGKITQIKISNDDVLDIGAKWSNISETPNTLSGYNITDGVGLDVLKTYLTLKPNFTISMDDDATKSDVSCNLMLDGEAYTPSAVQLKKNTYYSDRTITSLVAEGKKSSILYKNVISTNKESFKLIVKISGDLNLERELTQFICYIGAINPSTTLDSTTLGNLAKFIILGEEANQSVSVATTNKQKVVIAIPNSLSVSYISHDGLPFDLTKSSETIETDLGEYKVYVSTNELLNNIWNLEVHLN